MLPIIKGHEDGPLALVVENKRYHYGTAVSLPGGNIDGGLDTPEHPRRTAVRELQEETGYGYASDAEQEVSLFALRGVSNSIDYPRFFAVMHNVEYIGGQVHSPQEIVTPQPIPLAEYVDPLLTLERGEIYPEVNAAFAKANMELGRQAIMEWLVQPATADAHAIEASFDPWLIAQK